jgi:hypothetical protein
MADAYRQETGNSLMVIGWLLFLFSLAVVFFRSAANGIGRTTIDIARWRWWRVGLVAMRSAITFVERRVDAAD